MRWIASSAQVNKNACGEIRVVVWRNGYVGICDQRRPGEIRRAVFSWRFEMLLPQGLASQAYNGLAGVQAGAINVKVQPTVTSALARISTLNDRLAIVRGQLQKLAEVIGGPYPVEAAETQTLPSAGAVGQLNDSADYAHRYVGEIEDLLASISRSLG